MPKYQVTIRFEVNDEFMTLVPSHRTYINLLINNGNTMASQWDLSKMRLELQYFSEILLPNNHYRYNSNAAIFNKDKSLLAVYLFVEKQLIIYSIQYGIKLTTCRFLFIIYLFIFYLSFSFFSNIFLFSSNKLISYI